MLPTNLQLLKNEIYSDIHKIWDIVLFDGEEIINCCAIPNEMYNSIIDQVCDRIALKVFVFEKALQEDTLNEDIESHFHHKIVKKCRDIMNFGNTLK